MAGFLGAWGNLSTLGRANAGGRVGRGVVAGENAAGRGLVWAGGGLVRAGGWAAAHTVFRTAGVFVPSARLATAAHLLNAGTFLRGASGAVYRGAAGLERVHTAPFALVSKLYPQAGIVSAPGIGVRSRARLPGTVTHDTGDILLYNGTQQARASYLPKMPRASPASI